MTPTPAVTRTTTITTTAKAMTTPNCGNPLRVTYREYVSAVRELCSAVRELCSCVAGVSWYRAGSHCYITGVSTSRAGVCNRKLYVPADDPSGDFEELPPFDVHEPKTWTPLWVSISLPNAVVEKDFVNVLTKLGHDHTKFPSDYYCFVLRVCKVYHYSNKDNKYHLNRYEQCKQALVEVFNTVPRGERPHNGSPEDAVSIVLPLLEALFDMREGGPVPGTEAWRLAVLEHPSCLTIDQLVTMDDENHTLLKAFIKHMKDDCAVNADGYPVRNHKVPLYSDKYTKPQSKFKVSKRQVHNLARIPFIRNAAHVFAIKRLKQHNVYPVICPPKRTPRGSYVFVSARVLSGSLREFKTAVR